MLHLSEDSHVHPLLSHAHSQGASQDCDSPMAQHFAVLDAGRHVWCLFLGLRYHQPCFLRAPGSGSRQVAALCCGYLLRFRTWQLPGSECSWCEVTQNKRIFSLEGWGLTVRKRGAKQRQMYWINTGPEGWGFAPGWKPMSTLSVSLEMKQDYWRQALQSWRLWHFILCGFCGCPYISFCFDLELL